MVPSLKFDRNCKEPDCGCPLMKFGPLADSNQGRSIKSDHLWDIILKNVSKIQKPVKDDDQSLNSEDGKDKYMTNVIDNFYQDREVSFRIHQAHTFGVKIKEHGKNEKFKFKVENQHNKVQRYITPIRIKAK
jgi:hypothetical protein